MRYILPFLLILLLPLSFFCCITPKYDWYGKGDWVKKIDGPEIVHVIQNYLAYLRHEKHLRLEDSGVWYNETINTVRMEFISQDVLEVREARMLLVDIVEGLLVELNKNPVLAPEYITYPLTPQQLEIYVNFESFHGEYVDPYYVGWMYLEDGICYYYAFDLKQDGLNFWDYRIEPYYKSREFVIYERESEDLFKQAVEMEHQPKKLSKEQYVPVEKCNPRYFNPYGCEPLFD